MYLGLLGFWTATVVCSSSRIWHFGERLFYSPVNGKRGCSSYQLGCVL